MFTLLIVLHVLAAVSLVLIVLLQSGRGAELGAAFGGMGQSTFGPSKSTFLTKLTTSVAVVFMATSLTLAFLYTERPSDSLLSTVAPVAETTPAAASGSANGTAPAAADAAPATAPAAPAATPIEQKDAPKQ